MIERVLMSAVQSLMVEPFAEKEKRKGEHYDKTLALEGQRAFSQERTASSPREATVAERDPDQSPLYYEPPFLMEKKLKKGEKKGGMKSGGSIINDLG